MPATDEYNDRERVEMKNLVALIKEQKQRQNPGYKIGEFLLDHSNSSEYLIAQLETYLEAVKADHEEERKAFVAFMSKATSKATSN